jgi:hypothetical protein
MVLKTTWWLLSSLFTLTTAQWVNVKFIHNIIRAMFSFILSFLTLFVLQLLLDQFNLYLLCRFPLRCCCIFPHVYFVPSTLWMSSYTLRCKRSLNYSVWIGGCAWTAITSCLSWNIRFNKGRWFFGQFRLVRKRIFLLKKWNWQDSTYTQFLG